MKMEKHTIRQRALLYRIELILKLNEKISVSTLVIKLLSLNQLLIKYHYTATTYANQKNDIDCILAKDTSGNIDFEKRWQTSKPKINDHERKRSTRKYNKSITKHCS